MLYTHTASLPILMPVEHHDAQRSSKRTLAFPPYFILEGNKILIQRIHNNFHPHIMAAQACNNHSTKHPLEPSTPEALTL